MNMKVKGHPIACLCSQKGEAEVQLQSIRNAAQEGSKWPATSHSCTYKCTMLK